jgi:translation initiation factor IF-3
LINQNGENLGVVPIERALQVARDANLDLVEISASADPPVCKVLDLGKYLFEQNKKERQARKSQTKIEVKRFACALKPTNIIAVSKCAMLAAGWKTV